MMAETFTRLQFYQWNVRWNNETSMTARATFETFANGDGRHRS